MTALGNGITADRLLREWLTRHPASMLISKAETDKSVAQEATRLRLIETAKEAVVGR